MNDWISVKNLLPNKGEIVMAYLPEAVFETKKQRLIMFSDSKIWYNGTITHWKHKPQEP